MHRLWLALLLLAPWVSLATAQDSDGAAVRFISPRHRQTTVGPTPVRLAVRVPEGVSIVRVELRVDGQPLETLDAPPWGTTWDAGDGTTARELEARVVLDDGSEARTSIRTSALRIDQLERVELVNLYLTVRDRVGSYVTGLDREDFRVLENGAPQRIERFSTTHKPLRMGIVLDTSVSMSKADKLNKAKSAAIAFLDVLQAGDEGVIVAFSDTVRVIEDFSSERETLADAIRSTEPLGGTALYDAIWKTSRLLRDFDGRRVLVLLSDGRDEAANGLEPGSLHTLNEAIDQALRSEVIVFTIGIGRNLDREYAMRWGNLHGRSNVDTDRSLEGILRRLADATGGRAVITASTNKIYKAFDQFADDLRHQYSIAYSSSDERRDGKWRKLQVDTPDRDLVVVTRKGYYAPGAKRRR